MDPELSDLIFTRRVAAVSKPAPSKSTDDQHQLPSCSPAVPPVSSPIPVSIKPEPSVLNEPDSEEEETKDDSLSVSTVTETNETPSNEVISPPHENLRHIFNLNRDTKGKVPYYQDGNPEMDKPANLRRRAALKSEERVVNAINLFKNNVYRLENGYCTKDEYSRVHALIAKALYPSVTASMLKRLCEDDWKKDSLGKERISSDELFSLIFQLVDIWTMSVDVDEYIQFLDVLGERVRFAGSNNPNAYDVIDDVPRKKVTRRR
ncbi:hypothetical protein RCL1_000164 [Eukaryota sp. TZLM3-RCL]